MCRTAILFLNVLVVITLVHAQGVSLSIDDISSLLKLRPSQSGAVQFRCKYTTELWKDGKKEVIGEDDDNILYDLPTRRFRWEKKVGAKAFRYISGCTLLFSYDGKEYQTLLSPKIGARDTLFLSESRQAVVPSLTRLLGLRAITELSKGILPPNSTLKALEDTGGRKTATIVNSVFEAKIDLQTGYPTSWTLIGMEDKNVFEKFYTSGLSKQSDSFPEKATIEYHHSDGTVIVETIELIKNSLHFPEIRDSDFRISPKAGMIVEDRILGKKYLFGSSAPTEETELPVIDKLDRILEVIPKDQ